MSKIYNLPVPFFSQKEITYRWKQLYATEEKTGNILRHKTHTANNLFFYKVRRK